MTDATPRAEYVPPTGDDPLDAIQAALVRMWVNILADEIRAEVAAEIREEERAAAANHDAATTTAAHPTTRRAG